jgi:hypothetical protein
MYDVHVRTPVDISVFTTGQHKDVRFQVFTAATMKNAFIWAVKPQLVSQNRNITSSLQSSAD